MFISDYDPDYHDLYLYDNTNTGYPRGYNPNNPLYSCRESLTPLSVRSRTWNNYYKNPDYPDGPPLGTPISDYPNYYNNGQPLIWLISDRNFGGSIHYVGHFPSDTIPNGSYRYSKKTTLNNNTTYYLWSDYNFSGLSAYGPFYSIYNCVNGNVARTTNIQSRYFAGSPEIPGYETGNTYYQVLADDYGIMEQVTPKISKIEPIKCISPLSLAEILNLEPTNLGSSLKYTISDNCYFIDGQDRIVEIYITIYVDTTNYLDYSIEGSFKNTSYKIFPGDSSGLYLYKSGNTIYAIGHAVSYGAFSYGVNGNAHASKIYPVNQYFLNNNLLSAKYVYSGSTETEGATAAGINNLSASLQSLLLDMNDKISELSQ